MYWVTPSLAFLMADSARFLRRRFDLAARETGATGTQWRVLLTLSRQPGMTQSVLADLLDVEPITTCRMVDRLEQSGLLERRRDPADRRVWRVYVTDRAVPMIARLQRVAEEMAEETTAGLSAAEQDQLMALLSRVRENLSMLADGERPAIQAGGAAHG